MGGPSSARIERRSPLSVVPAPVVLLAALLVLVVSMSGCDLRGRGVAIPHAGGAEPAAVPVPAGSSGTETGTAAPAGGAGGGEDGTGPTTGPDVAEGLRAAEARRAALRDGVIVYRPPSPMDQGEVQRIVVRASGVAERGQLLQDLPGAPGTATERSIPIGLTLHAELKGDGFEVVSLDGSGAFRPTLPGDVAEWQWDIKPTDTGPKVLTLTVKSFYGDLTAPVAVRYIDETVAVDRSLTYSVGNLMSSPGWAATGLTVPALLTLLVAVRRRARTSAPAADDEAEASATGAEPPPRQQSGYL